MTSIIVLSIVLIISLLVWFVWRLASRRQSIPCPSWLAWLVEMDNPFAKSYGSRAIIQRLDLRPGMKVLDVGCGPGRLSIPIAQAIGPEGTVVAVDIQPAMLRRAKDKTVVAGVKNVEFVENAVGGGTLGVRDFDRAVLVTVLGEIPDRRAALKEIYESLKAGGILSVSEIIFDPHFQTRGTILGLAIPVGFKEHSFSGNRLSFILNLEKPGNP